MPNAERPHDSIWNFESLHAALSEKIDGATALLAQKIKDNFDSAEQRYQHTLREESAAVQSTKETLAAALASAKEAVDKADAANNKRFDNQNEWRGRMEDLVKGFVSQAQSDTRYESILAQLRTISTRLDKIEGSGAGMGRLWGLLVGGIGVLLLIADVWLRLRNGG